MTMLYAQTPLDRPSITSVMWCHITGSSQKSVDSCNLDRNVIVTRYETFLFRPGKGNYGRFSFRVTFI